MVARIVDGWLTGVFAILGVAAGHWMSRRGAAEDRNFRIQERWDNLRIGAYSDWMAAWIAVEDGVSDLLYNEGSLGDGFDFDDIADATVLPTWRRMLQAHARASLVASDAMGKAMSIHEQMIEAWAGGLDARAPRRIAAAAQDFPVVDLTDAIRDAARIELRTDASVQLG